MSCTIKMHTKDFLLKEKRIVINQCSVCESPKYSVLMLCFSVSLTVPCPLFRLKYCNIYYILNKYLQKLEKHVSYYNFK